MPNVTVWLSEKAALADFADRETVRSYRFGENSSHSRTLAPIGSSAVTMLRGPDAVNGASRAGTLTPAGCSAALRVSFPSTGWPVTLATVMLSLAVLRATSG